METNLNYNDLGHLELKVDHLLSERTRLVSENQSLRQQLLRVTKERATLADKNKRALVKMKAILSQLKEEIL